MAKSALDKLKALPAKELFDKLDCPHWYGIPGIYSKGTECSVRAYIPERQRDPEKDDEVWKEFIQSYCKPCWTKKI